MGLERERESEGGEWRKKESNLYKEGLKLGLGLRGTAPFLFSSLLTTF